jgi:hypothetical protein
MKSVSTVYRQCLLNSIGWQLSFRSLLISYFFLLSDFIENEFKKKNYSVEDTVDVLLKFDKKGKKKFQPITAAVTETSDSHKIKKKPNIEKEDIPYFGRAAMMDSCR